MAFLRRRYRDEGQRGIRTTQQVGKQDLSERNLIKVSLDYYIQGFCLSSLTLRPSAFYGAASARTAAIRAAIWSHVLANASSAAGAGARRCAPRDTARLSLEACQHEVCGIRDCNNNQ